MVNYSTSADLLCTRLKAVEIKGTVQGDVLPLICLGMGSSQARFSVSEGFRICL
jgi:hypothetical protein